MGISMSRNKSFTSKARELLSHHPHLQKEEVGGPLGKWNPTRATFNIPNESMLPEGYGSSSVEGGRPAPQKANDAVLAWRARDNRKGRHVLLVPKDHGKGDEPPLTTTWSAIGKGIWRMATVYAWWDVSWWIAVLFTIGSMIFIASGFFYWLPLEDPSSIFPDESLTAGGVTSFIGATLFTIGGVLLIVEASNDNQTGCFGWALEQAFSHDNSDTDNNDADNGSPPKKPAEFSLKATHCIHHHGDGVHRSDVLHMQHPDANRKWEWYPSWHELRDHYFHEIGFMASFVLAIGAVIFYISGIMALPGIINHLSQGVAYGIYWLAYLVGGILFVISSALYLIETQPTWYTPAPSVLGWWIGFWNMVGSVGWTLSASFGYCSASWCEYQSDLSLLWASVAFTIGSLLLWYEALDKYPVVRA